MKKIIFILCITACVSYGNEATNKVYATATPKKTTKAPSAPAKSVKPANKPVTTSKTIVNSSEEELNKRMSYVDKKYQQLLDKSGGVTDKIVEANNYAIEEWDRELNLIYPKVIDKLSKEKKVVLQQKQRDWIKQRDEKVKKAASKGGTVSLIESGSILLEETKARTIELSRMYDLL